MGKRDRKDANKETGRWTKEEHERFMQGLLQYGKNWKLVEQVVHTRTAAQVRSHAQKFFNRLDREQRKMKHVQEVEASPEEDSSEQSAKQESACLDETPQQIINLVRRNSKQDKTVNVNNFLDSLKEQTHVLDQDIKKRKQSSDTEPKQQIARLQRRNSQLKCMTNLVQSFHNVSEQQDKDQSYFINLVKKYKRYIVNNSFINLVDYPVHKELSEEIDKYEKKERKKSFHLCEENEQNLEQYNNLRKKVKADSDRGEADSEEVSKEVAKEVIEEVEKVYDKQVEEEKVTPNKVQEVEYTIEVISPKQTVTEPTGDIQKIEQPKHDTNGEKPIS